MGGGREGREGRKRCEVGRREGGKEKDVRKGGEKEGREGRR